MIAFGGPGTAGGVTFAGMSAALLETKLFVPRARSGLVPRPRLRGRLRAHARLVLVSAPPGFGKTTLLVDGLGGPGTAWLSLDAGDNDPTTFWAYVVAALGRVAPDAVASTRALLDEPQPPPVRQLLTTLINGLGAAHHDLTLVLDDYHVIDAASVHDDLEFLVDHLPPGLRLVIASRADPPLPLPRLRARGDLVEVRAADLRFTAEEAASYLNDTMALGLTAGDVTALERRTEGWAAALQLAALSIAGRTDVGAFVAGFAGDDRYVVDYLVEEVLERQPEQVRAFLLETSVLDRMTGPLCDAVTGRDGGRTMLEALDRANLFLVPLDDRREWFRYHHLFADVLRARLLDERPGRLEELHRLAGDWHERAGDRAAAVRHLLAGHDFPRAAELVEPELPALRRDRREATIRALIEALPDEVLRTRPLLCNGLAGAMMSTGTFDGVDHLLDEAERLMAHPADATVVDRDDFRRLPAGLAVHRAGLALVSGDLDGAVRHAGRALDLALDDDHLFRGAAAALQGLAAWTTGDLETARSSYQACLVHFERIGHHSDVLACSLTLADIELAQGRTDAALRTFRRGLELAARQANRQLRGTADMHVGIAVRHLADGDIAAARRELERARELGPHAGAPQNAYRWRVAMAQVREAEGDLDAAVELLDEADRLYDGDFSPNVRPVPALRARVWLRQGRVDDALAWAGERGLSAADDLSYLREYEHVTLALVLLADHERTGDPTPLADALGLLDRLLTAAEAGGRHGSVVEIGEVQALARRGGAVPSAPAAGGLVEPLSRRERDVLRLLGSDLSGPEIARELVVSLNTVRTHTKNIYLKLGVNSRRAAVRRARELRVL